MIIRSDSGLTREQILHNILNTSRMSLAAKGLIIYILNEKPDTYELSIHDLCIEHCCSQSWLEKIINELQEFGYINYELIKNNDIIDGIFTIYDVPNEISMLRYDFKRDFEKSISQAEKTFIRQFLNVNRRRKRDRKISTLMSEIRDSIVDWEIIYNYINSELTYDEFLNTEYWLIISQYLKFKRNFTCEDCGKKYSIFGQLNIHHLTYDRHGREHLEEVQDEDLLVLCEQCHKNRHKHDLGFERVSNKSESQEDN